MLEKEFKVYDKDLHQFTDIPLCDILEHLDFTNGRYVLTSDRYIVLQYIGHFDTTEHKLFEYDIVQTYRQDNSIWNTFYIHYIRKDSRWNISIDLIKYRKLRKIGNVFENIDLLPERYQLKVQQELGIKLIKEEDFKDGMTFKTRHGVVDLVKNK
jgi:hypothetical protein